MVDSRQHMKCYVCLPALENLGYSVVPCLPFLAMRHPALL